MIASARKLLAFSLMMSALIAFPAKAELPAVKLLSAPLVDPSAAWTFYGSGTTHTVGPGAWTSTPPQIKALARSLGAERLAASQITADQYASNVYDYVRNNIEIEFHFGLAKGGLGALVDQSGTDFDQAELMVKLLREGGVTTSYQVGTITLNAQQFGQWSGLVKNLNQSAQTFDVDAKAACQMIAVGGIPGTVNGASSCTSLSGNLSSIELVHAWVSANGKLYDPAVKKHYLRTGVDIAAAIGCGTASAPTCGSSLVSATTTGATQGVFGPASVPYIQNANETAVNAQLQTWAVNLQTYIENNMPSADLDDLIGGKRIDPSYAPAIGASLPYTSSAQYSWSGDVPDQFRQTLRVQFSSLDLTMFADDVNTRRLRVYATYGITLVADQLTLQTAGYTGSVNVTLTVNHSYAAATGSYGDDVITIANDDVQNTGIFSIVQTWGESTASTQKFFSDLQAIKPRPFRAVSGSQRICEGTSNNLDTSQVYRRECDGSSLPTLGASLAVQQNLLENILAQLANAEASRHHLIGVIIDPGASGNIIPLGMRISEQSSLSIAARDGSTTNATALFAAVTAGDSAIEGELGTQSQAGAPPISGISGFVFSNRNGHKILQVPNASIAATLGALSPYPSYWVSTEPFADNDLLIPDDPYPIASGAPTVLGSTGAVTGMYFPLVAYKSDRIAYIIGNNDKGGSVAGSDPTSVLKTTQDAAKSVFGGLKGKASLANGGLSLSADADIVTGSGEFPYSLAFKRDYASNSNAWESAAGSLLARTYTGADANDKVRLGGGWTHNYEIGAEMSSDALQALGQDSGLDASAIVAASFATLDSARAPSLPQRMAAILGMSWLGQNTVFNAVTVRMAPKSEVFTKLPSGRFNPPTGSPSILSQSSAPGGPYNYVPANALISYPLFDYAPVSFTYKTGDGSAISFDTASSALVYNLQNGSTFFFGDPKFKATQWTFPSGVKVTFTYTLVNVADANGGGPVTKYYYLTSVSNSLGRSLTFTSTQTGNIVNGMPRGDVGRVLTSVTDEAGRHADYASSNCPLWYYNDGDASAGAPITVTGWTNKALACNTLTVTTPDGAVTKYEYAPDSASPDPANIVRPNYLLRRVFAPTNLTTPYQTIAYDDMLRVKTITDSNGHVTKFYAAGLGGETYSVGQSVDPLGNVTTSAFEQKGRPARSVDPLGRITTIAYDDLARTTTTILPEGNKKIEARDVRSNVFSTTLVPKAGSPLANIVSTATYGSGSDTSTNGLVCTNPITCNKIFSENGPRTDVTDVTDYTWDSTYGLLTQIKPPADNTGVRGQSDFTYSAFGADNFRLLTSKTDKISTSSSVTTTYGYNTANKFVLQTATVDSGGLALRTCFKFDAVGNLISTSDPRTATCP